MSEQRVAPLYEDGLERAYPYDSSLGPRHQGITKGYGGNSNSSDKTNVLSDIIRRMPTSTLILAIALIILLVAAGIGGGIGASIAAKESKQCSITTVESTSAVCTPEPTTRANATTTSSGVYTVETNVLLPLDCPGLDSTPQTSTFAHRTSTFQMYCRNAYTYDQNKAILSIIVYSLHDCLQACVSFNHYVNSDNCTAVMFFSNLTSKLSESEANCFMATDTGSSSLKTDPEGNNLVTALIN
ncbi:hypothetical protein F5Y08DRAFT_308962 [Xylaria arbuscula]|nr:hypothetical protein F5Y08DRAFT_308962 [Xylaria arbuscula]